MDTEKTYQKWLRWISETENEVRRLCDARYRFETVRAIVNENPELDWSNRFLDHMRVWYFHYAAMAVRRQLKKNQDFSLIKLLDEIHANPSILSKDRYLFHYGYDDLGKELDGLQFLEEWAVKNGIHVDPEKLTRSYPKTFVSNKRAHPKWRYP